MAQHLQPASLKVLCALATYHYLTKPQMVQLGLAKSVASLDNHALVGLAPPRDSATGDEAIPRGKRANSYLCGTIRRGNRDPGERPGKQHYLYYLTQTGLDRLYWEYEEEFLNAPLGERIEDIWIPSPKDALSNEFHHRREYVSLHIAIRQWAEANDATIDFFTHDYQGDPKRPSVRGRPPSINLVTWDEATGAQVKPDGILGMTHKGVSRLYVVELHHRTPTKQIVEQLYRDFRAGPVILQKTEYQTAFDPYVLSVHSDRATLQGAQRLVAGHRNFSTVSDGLAFAWLPEIEADFSLSWFSGSLSARAQNVVCDV